VPFGKEKLLTPKQEKKLKIELMRLRAGGVTAKNIATKLNFGKPNSPYKDLNSNHVYFYANYFGLKRIVKRKLKKIENGINPELKNFYYKWRETMPENVANNLRKHGFLLNDPMEKNINEKG